MNRQPSGNKRLVNLLSTWERERKNEEIWRSGHFFLSFSNVFYIRDTWKPGKHRRENQLSADRQKDTLKQ